MFFIRSICPQDQLVHPEEKWHNKFAVWWMTAPLCVSCNGAGDKEASGRPIRALLFDKYGLVRCLKRWPGFIEPAILDAAKWVTGKLEAKEEAVRWHVGYWVWPMKWRHLEGAEPRPGWCWNLLTFDLQRLCGAVIHLWVGKVVKMENRRKRYHSFYPARTYRLSAGCWRWRRRPPPSPPHHPCPPPNIKCHTLRQWMDNGYPSIFRACLSGRPKPTTMSILRQFDPFSWVIHQPDLICKPPLFGKGRIVASAGTNGLNMDLFSHWRGKQLLQRKKRKLKCASLSVKPVKIWIEMNKWNDLSKNCFAILSDVLQSCGVLKQLKI